MFHNDSNTDPLYQYSQKGCFNLKAGLYVINYRYRGDFMKKLVILLLVLSFSRSFADDWFCKQGSSLILSDEIQTCGYSYRKDEGQAREEAMNRALNEFANICKSQSDAKLCLKRGWTSIPERTECNKATNGVKCYRMVRFTFNH